jgi:hypothetical protein
MRKIRVSSWKKPKRRMMFLEVLLNHHFSSSGVYSRVAQVLLDLDLAPRLLLDFVFHELAFVERLEREDVVWGGFGPDHVYTAEFT